MQQDCYLDFLLCAVLGLDTFAQGIKTRGLPNQIYNYWVLLGVEDTELAS